jgi:hypothetical protein
MSFDPKCFELAEHFLPSMASERLKNGLAQAVQTAVEDWMEAETIDLKTKLAPVSNVFSRAECIFNYCPHPDNCDQRCAYPRKSTP